MGGVYCPHNFVRRENEREADPCAFVFSAYDHVRQSCMCSDTDNNLRTKAVPTRPRQTLVNWLLIWILYYLHCLRMLAARSIVSAFYTTRSPLTCFHLPQ